MTPDESAALMKVLATVYQHTLEPEELDIWYLAAWRDISKAEGNAVVERLVKDDARWNSWPFPHDAVRVTKEIRVESIRSAREIEAQRALSAPSDPADDSPVPTRDAAVEVIRKIKNQVRANRSGRIREQILDPDRLSKARRAIELAEVAGVEVPAWAVDALSKEERLLAGEDPTTITDGVDCPWCGERFASVPVLRESHIEECRSPRVQEHLREKATRGANV